MPEQKLICGILHYRLPCIRCGEVIWTAGRRGGVCTECIGLSQHRFPGNGRVGVPRSEADYHGERTGDW